MTPRTLFRFTGGLILGLLIAGPAVELFAQAVMQLSDGTFASKVAVYNLDGSAATFGSGTQYTEAATDASITGTAILWEDAADTLRPVSSATPLPVDIAGAALTALQLSDNVVYVDDADFTDGTSSLGLVGCVAESAGPSTVTEGDIGACAMTLNRAVKVTLYNSSGTELTTTEEAEDGAHTDGDLGPVVMSRRIDVAASSAGTTGDYAVFNTDALGQIWARHLDPCTGVAKTAIPIDISTATTTELTASLAGASTHYYVCSLNLVTAAANNVALVDDDSDNCASVTSGVAGGFGSAAEGWNFGANGGLTLGNGGATVAKTNGTNRVLCLMTSAATQLSGAIVVAAAP